MLKFQVTSSASSSNRFSASPQRLSQISSSSSSSSSFSSSHPSAIGEHNVDRSIDELEEFIVQQMATPAPYPTDGKPFYDTNECAAAANAVPLPRRFASLSDLSPSFSSSSSSPSSSSSSSSSSLNCGTLGRRKSPAPQPPKPKRMTAGEWDYLRVYTAQIKTDTDYKTLRVPAGVSTECVIRQLVLDKLRLSLRDLNLFHLFMEVRTRRMDGTEARSILELDRIARPLELQKCHPVGMSRFILGMDSNAILARIYDGEVNPESNYKSVLISRRTCCAEVLQMLCQMSRPSFVSADCRLRPARDAPSSPSKAQYRQQLGLDAISELRLFVDSPRGAESALIPAKCPLAGVYTALMPGQRIALRRVIVPRADGFP
ncbi:hypothetical protein niasHS_012459 [Heterodera schachtii]|uniref:Ras-associating domain-containing protein n=1 Tax=Heterodera schachtii TaxID=97005 RepID=A0ABD2IJP7_HETSC